MIITFKGSLIYLPCSPTSIPMTITGYLALQLGRDQAIVFVGKIIAPLNQAILSRS